MYPKSLSPQHHSDDQIGVHIIDSWTYYALEFLNKVAPKSQATMQQFVCVEFSLLHAVILHVFSLIHLTQNW